MTDLMAARAEWNSRGASWAVLLDNGQFVHYHGSWDIQTACRTPEMVAVAYLGDGEKAIEAEAEARYEELELHYAEQAAEDGMSAETEARYHGEAEQAEARHLLDVLACTNGEEPVFNPTPAELVQAWGDIQVDPEASRADLHAYEATKR